MEQTNLFRKKELYETLERLGDTCYVDQEELARIVGLYPSWEGKPFHNSTARRNLSRDIQEINSDPAFPRIILSSSGSKGVKLASKEEAMTYILRLKIPCFRKIKRISALEQKVCKFGQYDLDGKEYGKGE